MKTANDQRRKELALIHLAAKQLGLDRESYESMLFTVCRVRSAADLDAAGRRAVLTHLASRGARIGRHYPGRPRKPSQEKRALMGKIEALLASAERPWAYAQAMARRMFHRERLEWCAPDELHRIVAALEYDARRHGRAQK